MTQFQVRYKSPIGWLSVCGSGTSIKHVYFDDQSNPESESNQPEWSGNLTQQLDQYFEGARSRFHLPLDIEISDFQQKVLSFVSNIKYGRTVTYKEIALALGDIKTVRAVGLANAKNPVPILIPCHRVIGSTGKLTGYAGGLERKSWLLKHEGFSLL